MKTSPQRVARSSSRVEYTGPPAADKVDTGTIRALQISPLNVDDFIAATMPVVCATPISNCWDGVSLARRSAADASRDRMTPPDVAVLEPILAAIPGAYAWVRILIWRLAPEFAMPWHQDPKTCRMGSIGLDPGEIASIHVPLKTNVGVSIESPAGSYHFATGEPFYLNVSHPHRAVNRGSSIRTELLIDSVVTTELLEALPL